MGDCSDKGFLHCTICHLRDLPSSEDQHFLSLLHVLYELQCLKQPEWETLQRE
jgi:hypothetical protein